MTPEGQHKPIFFPGGDPLARLAPAPGAAQPAPQPKKKRKIAESVLGLAPMPKGGLPEIVPGPVVRPIPGPVTLLQPAPTLAPVTGLARLASSGGEGSLADDIAQAQAAARAAIAAFAAAPAASLAVSSPPSSEGNVSGGVRAAASGTQAGEFICEICMRKFNTKEALTRHEQLSDLHKQNLAKFQGTL